MVMNFRVPARLVVAFLCAGALSIPLLSSDALRPPAVRPLAASVHALVGGRVVLKPGEELEMATVVLRDGRIEGVGKDMAVPADARVHDMMGTTIYAGFIDAHVSFAQNGSKRAGPMEEDPPVGFRGLTAGAGGGFAGAPSVASGTGPDSVVIPQRRMAREHAPDPKALEALRAEGFTVANVVPDRGVIRGTSVLVSLGSSDPAEAILRSETFQHIALTVPGDDPRGAADNNREMPRAYPASLMGVIAVVRQTFFDAQFQADDGAHFAANAHSRPRPEVREPLVALLPAARKGMPVCFEPGGILMVDRAMQLSRELNLQPVLLATGQEWRRPDLIRAADAPFIVPIDFPEVPKLPDEDDWIAVPTDQLRAWDQAPGNPGSLRLGGREIALSTHGLDNPDKFRANARLAIARGLRETDALAALTTVPARLLGAADQLGDITAGKLANLTVVENGRYFDEEARVREVWIEGRLFSAPPKDERNKDAKNEKKETADAEGAGKPDQPDKKKENEALRGRLTDAPAQHDRGPLLAPPAVFVKSAVLWTSGPQGRLENAGLLIVDGRIKAVGTIAADQVPAGAMVIDRPGIHVTPGLIDCHSHSMVLGGVNEGTLPSTAMVRIADVVNSETETIHQQLAGGLTVANLLHGSANPIGGQNCVIKLRDGAGPDGLKFEGAPGGIKFALGENVKQSNWGDGFRQRFPQTRMGVPAFHTNRFAAARHYAESLSKQQREGGAPVRRDLELEALAEIIKGERLVHCHSYRQDEVVAFLRVMESFGVRVATLQHILEGYKVADEIARHGAGASAFSDWWAYKLEVYDAIPHAGSLMRERGVLVSFNSDSSDLARRLNLEAAKAVKYGGTSEEEALKFVTLNPARQLGIANRVGSLEPGKDGDFVIWSAHPLDTLTVCQETWIEGKQYFERAEALRRAGARRQLREALLAKAKTLARDGPDGKDNEKGREKFFHRALEDRQNHRCLDCCLDHEMPWTN